MHSILDGYRLPPLNYIEFDFISTTCSRASSHQHWRHSSINLPLWGLFVFLQQNPAKSTTNTPLCRKPPYSPEIKMQPRLDGIKDGFWCVDEQSMVLAILLQMHYVCYLLPSLCFASYLYPYLFPFLFIYVF